MSTNSLDEATILALKQQAEKQRRELDQLMGRLNYLMKQQREYSLPEAKTSHRLADAYEKKKRHDELKEEVWRQLRLARQQIRDPVPEQKRRNLQLRFNIDNAVRFAVQQVNELKKVQAATVKHINEKNEARIRNQKLQNLEEKQANRKLVQHAQHEWKVNYQRFIENRQNNFIEEHKRIKGQLSSSLNSNEEMFHNLEKMEMALVEKIQKSKSAQQFLKNQIKDAQTMKVVEYERKYGKPKPNKFNQIMSIQAKLN